MNNPDTEYSHFKFHYDSPEFKRNYPNGQQVIVIKDRTNLPAIIKKYPNSAFWGIVAFQKYISHLESTYENKEDRKKDFAQINTLKIVFGPGNATLLLEEMDQRKYCAENQIDWKWFEKWMNTAIDDLKIERKPWRPFHGIKPKGWREPAEVDG